MAQFDDLNDFFDPDLTLPIRGKNYRIQSPNAEDGLRLRRFYINPEATSTPGKDDYLEEIMKILGAEWDEDTQEYVGGVWGEMADDGVSWPEMMHAGETAVMYYGLGEAQAKLFWKKDALVPKAPTTPDEPTPRPAKKTGSKASTVGTTRGRARTGKTTQAAANQTP